MDIGHNTRGESPGRTRNTGPASWVPASWAPASWAPGVVLIIAAASLATAAFAGDAALFDSRKQDTPLRNSAVIDPATQDTVEPDADAVRTPREFADQPAPQPLSDAALAQILGYDPATFAPRRPGAFRSPLTKNPATEWNRDANTSGGATYSVKQVLTPEWNIRAGADLTVPPDQTTTYRPGSGLPGAAQSNDPGKGGAWASATVPDVADIELRVDPGLSQNKLGATMKRTIPIGDDYSLTFQNRVSMIDNGLGSLPTSSAVPQVWDSEKAARFNILTTGTSFGAGTSTSTRDGVTHHTLSAEQRVYGPLHINGSITDPGKTSASESVGAKFKIDW